MNALVFLYRHVLKQPFLELGEIERAKRPGRIPVVFTREEVTRLLAHLSGTAYLMASLLYGSGLRLMECVRLRVKDLDFAYHPMTVREGKGAQAQFRHASAGKWLRHPYGARTPGAQGRQNDHGLYPCVATWRPCSPQPT